jgi:hypothetical protein
VSYQFEEKMMSGASLPNQPAPPEFAQLMGHPRPLWMLFMSEFWERFAFYGIRWALVLYIVAQFHGGDASGQQSAGLIYGPAWRWSMPVIFGGCRRQVPRIPAFDLVGAVRPPDCS